MCHLVNSRHCYIRILTLCGSMSHFRKTDFIVSVLGGKIRQRLLCSMDQVVAQIRDANALNKQLHCEQSGMRQTSADAPWQVGWHSYFDLAAVPCSCLVSICSSRLDMKQRGRLNFGDSQVRLFRL